MDVGIYVAKQVVWKKGRIASPPLLQLLLGNIHTKPDIKQ